MAKKQFTSEEKFPLDSKEALQLLSFDSVRNMLATEKFLLKPRSTKVTIREIDVPAKLQLAFYYLSGDNIDDYFAMGQQHQSLEHYFESSSGSGEIWVSNFLQAMAQNFSIKQIKLQEPTSLFAAILIENLNKQVSEWWKNNVDNPSALNKKLMQTVYLAAYEGNIDILNKALECIDKTNSPQEKQVLLNCVVSEKTGNTSLMVAMIKNNVEAVRILVKHGASSEVKDTISIDYSSKSISNNSAIRGMFSKAPSSESKSDLADSKGKSSEKDLCNQPNSIIKKNKK